MSTLLVEVGTEEIPAAFVAGALEALPGLVRESLGQARLSPGDVHAWGTPRRLAFAVFGLAERQPDREEEVTGPPKSAAIGPDGQPTKAGLGFAKKMGVAPEELRIVETPKGPYVAATRRETGRSAREVLAEEIPSIWKRLAFPKSMKWEVDSGPFARPIHWILSRLDGEVLGFELAGISASGVTRGHRFIAPAPVEVHDPGEYLERLRAARVLADPVERRATLASALADAAKAQGAALVPDEALVDEVNFLVEWPAAVVGTFDPSHLALPRAVILSAMRGHQRCFALEDVSHALLPAFIAVAQTCESPAQIRKGNERVIRARLADARFFFDQDRRHPLSERLPALDGMTFQARLGSMGDRSRRTQALAGHLAERFAPDARTAAERAAALAKADLATQMVGEFPDLQGIVGEAYARTDGEPEDVARAIGEQYLPKGPKDALPATAAGAIVSLADRLVVLAGGFAAGLAPTGTADPFGLRRACIGAIRILWERGWSVSLRAIAGVARWQPVKGKTKPEAEVDAAFVEFFAGRIRSLVADEAPVEMIEAVLAASDDDVVDVRSRILALAAYRSDAGWAKLAVAFRRAWNITKTVEPGPYDRARLEPGAEADLAEIFAKVEAECRGHFAARRYTEGLRAFGALAEPLHRYFSEVFVMVEDEAVRANRLKFLRGIVEVVRPVAHLHLLGGDAT